MNDKVSPSSNQRLDEIRARVKEHKDAVEFGSTIFNQADLDRAALLEMIDRRSDETTARPMLDKQRRKVFSEHLAAAIRALDMRNAYPGPMSPDRAILTSLVEYLEKSPEEPARDVIKDVARRAAELMPTHSHGGDGPTLEINLRPENGSAEQA